MRRQLFQFGFLRILALMLCIGVSSAAVPTLSADEPLSLVVMDPLAAPLSCPCVEGYAQRDYEVLAEFLTSKLGRPVQVTFAESLEQAFEKPSCEHADVIIGKDSVARWGAQSAGYAVTPVARLTDKQGQMTQTGLIVVRSDDPAIGVTDLAGYRILFGPIDCDEKFAAPRDVLIAAGVEIPPTDECETSAACSDGACKILEWGSDTRAAAVISSYAAPLLEGCGTIKKGDLRVVAETEPVPFITAFVTDRLDATERAEVAAVLLAIVEQPTLLVALESLTGFVEPDEAYLKNHPPSPAPPVADEVSASDISASEGWPGWAGPRRDGHAAWLPTALPSRANIAWKNSLYRPGLGGVAATGSAVLIGDRDLTNNFDEWRCYEADDGAERWTLTYPAVGELDWDNCPRATPLIDNGRAYLLGAFGDLHCVDMQSGDVIWQINLRVAYGAEHELVWGCCSSPLLVDGKLIVNPGAPDAAWAALDAATGDEVWRAAGDRHAYASPLLATLGGVRQIVAYDRTSLFGLDPETGDRLWTLKPPTPGDFNVPTPIVIDDKLLVVSENNGARLHAFDSAGRIVAEPVAHQRRLAPDMSTPVLVGDRVFCVWKRLFCLNAATLDLAWATRDPAFTEFGPLIATNDRLLATGRGGELVLIDTTADECSIVSRLSVSEAPAAATGKFYSQPALVGSRLYLRTGDALLCIELATAS